jgi:N-acetylglucosaminyldiphosphoundecaprenol N-acetyl-beta-D-mannosaminyltransferase
MNHTSQQIKIESIPVDLFESPEALFDRILYEIDRPGTSVVSYLNIHVANTASRLPGLKNFLRQANVGYWEGAGIKFGAKLTGQNFSSGRLTAADWLFDLWDFLRAQGKSFYYVGGAPGVIEKALTSYEAERDLKAPVIGHHHGYILKDPDLEQAVLEDIQAKKPDILFVGMGTPVQEAWIERLKQKLKVPVIYPLGATADFLSGEVSRCPDWLGQAGFEWLYRLLVEPRRMFARYVIGNPWFLLRVMTLHWMQFIPGFLTAKSVRNLRSDF